MVTELVTLLLIASVVLLVVYGQRRPQPLSANAPAAVFSSGRAMEHLRKIADKPHPLGTSEHAAVRDYLLQELNGLGFATEIQKTTGINRKFGNPVTAGTVENIVAKLPGTGSPQSVLLMGHYDSVPTGPGASDDGSSVAAILETARALKTESPLKNDVILLFTDGEEAGLLGATAFIAEHPLAKDVGVALNFEARGSSGPVLMFETSNGNARLIDEFAASAPYPAANSLLSDVYRLLPNDTDLSVFKQAKLRGLNFAFVNQPTHYHTQLDNIANIDERSLQQQGAYLLGLTRYLGNADLSVTTNQNAVYFDLFNSFVVHYPVSWAIPLAMLALLLLIVVVGLGLKRRQLRLSGIALGLLAMALSMTGAWLIVTLVWRIVLMLHSQYRLMPNGDTYNSELYLVSFIALTAAIAAFFGGLFGKRVAMLDLWVGALSGWQLLLICTVVFLPGGSYLLTWPLLLSLLAVLFTLIRKDQAESPSVKRQVVLLVGLATGLILFVPIIRVLFEALTVGSSALVMVTAALLFGLFVPQIQMLTRHRRWLLSGALGLVSIAFLIAGGLTSGFDQNRPRPNNILYGFDATAGQSVWASTDAQTDEWTTQFFSQNPQRKSLPEFFPLRSAEFRTASAPVTSLTAPSVEVVTDNRNNGMRTLNLKIASPRQASVIAIGVESDMEVHGTMINGKPIKIEGPGAPPAGATKWGLRYFAVPADGIELTLEAKSSQPLAIRVVDQSYGLPQFPEVSYRPRTASTIPAPLPFTDSVFVSRSFSF
jgi:hypothetical protein